MIEGSSVRLVPLQLMSDELLALQSWLQDSDVIKYMGYTKTVPQTEEHIDRYLNKLLQNPDVRIFKMVVGKEYIGNIRVDINWMWRVGVVSLLVGKQFWKKGYGSEAIELITKFAHDTLGMHRVEAGILDGNVGSVKAFEKAGYELEGTRVGRRFCEGKHIDEYMVSHVKK